MAKFKCLQLSILVLIFASQTQADYWAQCQNSQKKKCIETSPANKEIPAVYKILGNGKNPTVETLSVKNNEFSKEISSLESGEEIKTSETLNIEVDPSIKFQEIWGFGGSITDSCLANLEKMSPSDRKKLMQDIFSRQSGAGFSYLRVPLGANDFSNGDYSLNDTANNKPDPQMKHFDKSKLSKMVSFIKEAKAINPSIKILVSPWTPPAWMKDTKKLRGGQLLEKYHAAYAKYLAKSVETFQENGIQINHMTILNEPLIGYAKTSWEFPQAYMSTEQQKKFLTKNIVPLMKKKNFPRILAHDHNWDNSAEAEKLVNDPRIKPALAGVAMHCYGGDENAEKEVIANYSSSNVMNTECTASFSPDDQGANSSEIKQSQFSWWLRTQSLDSLRAGSSGGLGWNLCLDETGGPQNNGCKDCRGLVTIDQKNHQKVIFNPEFQALAFSSRALQNGAHRIHSNSGEKKDFTNVAFKNPDGKIVVLLHNNQSTKQIVSLKIRPCSNTIQIEMPPQSASSVYF
jgi:glucosylceramidase